MTPQLHLATNALSNWTPPILAAPRDLNSSCQKTKLASSLNHASTVNSPDSRSLPMLGFSLTDTLAPSCSRRRGVEALLLLHCIDDGSETESGSTTGSVTPSYRGRVGESTGRGWGIMGWKCRVSQSSSACKALVPGFDDVLPGGWLQRGEGKHILRHHIIGSRYTCQCQVRQEHTLMPEPLSLRNSSIERS